MNQPVQRQRHNPLPNSTRQDTSKVPRIATPVVTKQAGTMLRIASPVRGEPDYGTLLIKKYEVSWINNHGEQRVVPIEKLLQFLNSQPVKTKR